VVLRLIIAEDSLLVREGVAKLLGEQDDVEVVALCADYDELMAAVAEHSPPMFGPKPVKLLFATQAESDPPLIVIAANHGRCLSPAYERYLLRRFRTRWNLRGVPVRLVVRGRGKGNHERA
jgi:hypothetical protein